MFSDAISGSPVTLLYWECQYRKPHFSSCILYFLYRVFDRQQKGYIEAGDLKVTMKQLGVTLTNDDVKAMMHDAGVKADGRIYYEGLYAVIVYYCHLQCTIQWPTSVWLTCICITLILLTRLTELAK